MNIVKMSLCDVIKEVASKYIESDFADTTNLLGITSVRNIVYMLLDLEKQINLNITSHFLDEVENFTVETLVKEIPKHIQ